MSLCRDEAIVLRTQKLGEADRIVTLLTHSHGKVRAVGKGVRRTSSRFGARLEPFMLVDVQLHTGRSLDIVTQVETIEAFARPVCEDYAMYTAGTAMLETADRVVEAEKEPAPAQFRLLTGAVRSLAQGAHAPGLVLNSYVPATDKVGLRVTTAPHPRTQDIQECPAPGRSSTTQVRTRPSCLHHAGHPALSRCRNMPVAKYWVVGNLGARVPRHRITVIECRSRWRHGWCATRSDSADRRPRARERAAGRSRSPDWQPCVTIDDCSGRTQCTRGQSANPAPVEESPSTIMEASMRRHSAGGLPAIAASPR